MTNYGGKIQHNIHTKPLCMTYSSVLQGKGNKNHLIYFQINKPKLHSSDSISIGDAPPKKTKDMFHVNSQHILETAKSNAQGKRAVMH